jgi:hypothetical protein
VPKQDDRSHCVTVPASTVGVKQPARAATSRHRFARATTQLRGRAGGLPGTSRVGEFRRRHRFGRTAAAIRLVIRFQLPRRRSNVWDVAFKLGSDLDHRGGFIYPLNASLDSQATGQQRTTASNAQSPLEVDLRVKAGGHLGFRLSEICLPDVKCDTRRVRGRSNREEPLMEGSSAAVPGIQPPRFERRRRRGFVGCTLAVLAALLCASLFAATARAEDGPPSVSDGSATSDSMPSDAASTASSNGTAPRVTSDTSATTTDGSGTADTTDACATAPDATDTSAITTDTSAAAAGTTDTCATAPGTTDTSATTTDGSAAGAGTTSTCASLPDAADTSAKTTDPSATVADTTDTCATAPDATDTTDGATAADPSAAPADASGAASSDAAADSETDTSNSTNDPTGTSTGPAAAQDTRALSSSGSSSSGTPVQPASPPGPNLQAPSDATTSDSLSDSTSSDEDAEADPLLGDQAPPIATAVPQGGMALTLTFAVAVIRCGVDCRVTIVCDATSGSLLLASCPAKPEATQARRLEARTNGAHSRPDGAPGSKSPRLPSPDHEPPMPPAPGASSGSGSSGGLHAGSTLGVTAAVLSLTPRDGTRPITLIELCRRALPLAFLLDRPG